MGQDHAIIDAVDDIEDEDALMVVFKKDSKPAKKMRSRKKRK